MLTEKDLKRFWNLVQKGDTCWTWNGYRNDAGYGVIVIQRIKHRAHRIAFELAGNTIPEGLHVLHKCDNPSCVNPSHLFTGDPKANCADKCQKGRQSRGEIHGLKVAANCPRGERSYLAKVKETDVIKARQLHANGHTYAAIAAMLNIRYDNVGHIIRRESWTHLP